MKYRQLALTLGFIISGIFILFNSCKKINEATELGGDLIPPIDNIYTFDTTISVEAYNNLFQWGLPNPSFLNDSTRVNSTDEHFLGRINSDPFFGKTDARIFLELKPAFYRHSFINHPDSLSIDSVVLILDYAETYGDSMVSQTINVFELDPSSNFLPDSSYLIRENNFTYSTLLGTKIVLPASLKDSVRARQDTTSHQLRITLNNSFGTRLLTYDSISSSPNNAYSSDSAFKSKFKGFAIQSMGAGNAVMGFNLRGANTKLAIYYKDDNNGGPILSADTAVAYFRFFENSSSGSANYIQRDYSGTPLLAAQGGTTPDPVVYIQNTPGSFATLKIPALPGLSNRVVHRAELIAEQFYHISDSIFKTPAYMYLDAFDPALAKYRTIPYDVVYDGSAGSFNFGSFGVNPINALDGLGNVVKTWKLNLTRYVQHVVNDTEPSYDLRLFSPLYVVEQYTAPIMGATPAAVLVNLNPATTKGRVRLHNIRLRIIYSKL